MLEIGDVENKNLVHFEKKKLTPPLINKTTKQNDKTQAIEFILVSF